MFISKTEYVGIKSPPKDQEWASWYCACGVENFCPKVDFLMCTFKSYPYTAIREEIHRVTFRKCFSCGEVQEHK